MTGAILITGHLGGLGSSLVKQIGKAGYTVVGLDRDVDPRIDYPQIAVDLRQLADKEIQQSILNQIRQSLSGLALKALINNAALQVVRPLETLTDEDLHNSITVNAIAPFLLSRLLLDELERAGGTIVNISSIHASQTKKNFGAYSISKSALSAVSRAMALEWGSRIRVIELRPAAIATDMLEDGFKDHPEGRRLLDEYHPSGRIGTPDEIGRIVMQLIELDAPFLNGTIVNVDGGITHSLHDPDG